MKYQFEKLKSYADNKENHITLSSTDIEKFSALCDMLLEANKNINLTTIDKPEEVEVKHFIDSLTVVDIIKNISDGEQFSLIDIGCGAGFPGIPLKIAFPGADIVLVDSVGKKIEFVQQVIEKLKLDKIIAETERVEQLARTQYRAAFDFCTSRAVSSISVLLEYMLPFLKINGYCILYKGGNYKEELNNAQNALEILGGEVHDIKNFVLPYSTADRSLIVVRKTKETPEKYPRKTGKPEKSPL